MANEGQPRDRSEVSQTEGSVTKDVDSFAFVRSEEFVEVYANYVSLATSPWDITIMFGRTAADNPNNPRIEQRASVSLSPQTAKAIAEILWRNIQAYEQQYGEIRYTPRQPSQSEQAENPPQSAPPITSSTPRRRIRLDDQDA
jgi:hypothetical protein